MTMVDVDGHGDASVSDAFNHWLFQIDIFLRNSAIPVSNPSGFYRKDYLYLFVWYVCIQCFVILMHNLSDLRMTRSSAVSFAMRWTRPALLQSRS